eukprot:1005766-Rhodomonas_salina.2
MSGTYVSYGDTASFQPQGIAPVNWPDPPTEVPCIVLRACYAMSGTDIGFTTTRTLKGPPCFLELLPGMPYGTATRCPVLTCIDLRDCYAMSATD